MTRVYLGQNGVRDPAHPCNLYFEGRPSSVGDCASDGHYLCNECVRRATCVGCGLAPDRFCRCDEIAATAGSELADWLEKVDPPALLVQHTGEEVLRTVQDCAQQLSKLGFKGHIAMSRIDFEEMLGHLRRTSNYIDGKMGHPNQTYVMHSFGQIRIEIADGVHRGVLVAVPPQGFP